MSQGAGRAVIATAALTAGMLTQAPGLTGVAEARAWRPGCSSATAAWKVIANNYFHKQVGTLHRVQTRCWGRRGNLTNASVRTWFTTTSVGSAFGVGVEKSGPYIMHRDGGMYQWDEDFAMKACGFAHLMWCGPTMDFKVTTMVIAPRLSGWHWTGPFCATRECARRVTFTRSS